MASAYALAYFVTRGMGPVDEMLTVTLILGGEALLLASLRF